MFYLRIYVLVMALPIQCCCTSRLVRSSGCLLSKALVQFLFGSLTGLSASGLWRVTPRAIEGMNLFRIGVPRSDISRINSITAFSSNGMRYCWLWAFASMDLRPRARAWSVERGIGQPYRVPSIARLLEGQLLWTSANSSTGCFAFSDSSDRYQNR